MIKFLTLGLVSLLAQLGPIFPGPGSPASAGGGGGGGTFAAVSNPNGYNYIPSGSNTTITATMTAVSTTKHFYVTQVLTQQTAGAITVAGAGCASWTAIGTIVSGTGVLNGYRAQMFYCTTLISGSQVITATFPTANFCDIEVLEYSYTGTSITVQASTYSTTAASGTTASVGPLSSTASGTNLYLSACLAVNSDCTAGSGWTDRSNSGFKTNTGGLFEDKLNQTTLSQTATYTTGSGDDVMLGLAVFQ